MQRRAEIERLLRANEDNPASRHDGEAAEFDRNATAIVRELLAALDESSAKYNALVLECMKRPGGAEIVGAAVRARLRP